MLFRIVLVIIVIWPNLGVGEIVMAKRTVQSGSILVAQDFALEQGQIPGTVSKIDDILGLESRRVLFRGRPVLLTDVGPAAVIERNQRVTLVYVQGHLLISVEARSLGRAGIGDRLLVMNLGSKNTVTGLVQHDGSVVVGSMNSTSQQ